MRQLILLLSHCNLLEKILPRVNAIPVDRDELVKIQLVKDVNTRRVSLFVQ